MASRARGGHRRDCAGSLSQGYAHGAPEPPRPTPLGRHEADFSRRAVNRRSGSEGCGQSGDAREFRGAGLPSKGILSVTCLLGESRRIDKLTAGLGRPRDKRNGYKVGILHFRASTYFILKRAPSSEALSHARRRRPTQGSNSSNASTADLSGQLSLGRKDPT